MRFGQQRLLFGVFLLLPVAYVLAWRILPALYTVFLSFASYNLAYDPAPRLVGVANYLRLASDRGLFASLRITVEFSFLVTPIELGLGLVAAILFDREFRGRSVLLGILLVPMITAPVVVGTVWRILFDNIVGPIPYWLRQLHGPNILWFSNSGTALFTLIIADVWEWTPLMALLMLSALQTIPREMIDAAMVDGASGWKLFRFITIPQILAMIVLAVGLRFMDAFLELDKVIVMTGGGPGTSTELVSMHIYRSAFQYYTLGYAAAIVIALLLMLSVMYGLYFQTASKSLWSPLTQ